MTHRSNYRPTVTSRLQANKLLRLVSEAYANVPFYRNAYRNLGVGRRAEPIPDVISRLPIVTKKDLLDASPDDRLDTRFELNSLFPESTTGSTGEPFTIFIDSAYRRRRNFRFLRALATSGYRPWHRMMLLTDRYNDPIRKIGNRYYVSVEQSTSDICKTFLQIRPKILYGFMTPLRLLADHIQANESVIRSIVAVLSTAEMLDQKTAALFQGTWGCPVHDFYGLTETGLIAWRRSNARVYRRFNNSVLTEFMPTCDANDLHRVVVTNLDLRSSPIIRYDTGDLASIARIGGVQQISSLHGREIDTLVSTKNLEISPYRITDALRDLPELRQFKVTQTTLRKVEVDLEIATNNRDRAAEAVRFILHQQLGAEMQVSVNFHEKLVQSGIRKFRSIESRLVR